MTDRWVQLQRRRELLEGLSASEFTQWTGERRKAVFRHHYFSQANTAYHGHCGNRKASTSLAAWSEIPFVDKGFLNTAQYTSKPAWSGCTVLTSTSGTTSTAVEIPHTTRSARTGLGDNFLRALLHGGASAADRHWGIEHSLRGSAVTGSQLSMRYLRRYTGEHALVTATHTPLQRQFDQAVPFDPWSISSSPGFLTRLALEGGTHTRLHPRVVLFGGAGLDDAARGHIENSLHPERVIAFYPTTDAGALGVSPSANGVYETFSETHWMEVVNDDGTHVSEGETGFLAVTSYDNFAAPLIRYCVGDQVRFLGWRSNRLMLSEITRQAEAALGATLLPLKDLSEWTGRLQSLDHDVVGVQLVRRTTAEGIDQPVIRVVVQNLTDQVRSAAIHLLDDFPQVAHEIASAELLPPIVEHAQPGVAMRGVFKLAPYVDDRKNT